jgi:hypothetical protein
MHENLISTGHSKSLKPSQHGFVLLQSLSSAMGDLCINIPNEVLKSDDAVKAILNTVTNLSPDDDVHAKLEIMDKIHTIYRRENQSVSQFCQLYITWIERYIEVVGKLPPRLKEGFALDLVRMADLEDTVKATVLTNAINHCSGSFAANQREVVFSVDGFDFEAYLRVSAFQFTRGSALYRE